MNNLASRVLASALAFAALSFVPGSAEAEPDDAALAHQLLVEGYALVQAGQCAQAIPRFLRSHELRPQVKVLLNLARCEEQEGKFVDALRHWAEARTYANEQNLPAVVVEAEGRRAALDARVPRLTVEVSKSAPVSTAVKCDGTAVAVHGPTPRTLMLDPGEHSLVASAPGYADETFVLTLATGSKTVTVVHPGPAIVTQAAATPETTAKPARLPPDEGQADDAPSLRRSLGWISLVGGGVLIGGGVIAHVIRERNASIYADDQLCLVPGRYRDDVCGSHRATAETAQPLAIAGYALGGSAAVLGVVLLATSSPRAPRRVAAGLSCGPLFGTPGLACAGRFP